MSVYYLWNHDKCSHFCSSICRDDPENFWNLICIKSLNVSVTMVAHTCNPTYLRGWDQEDWGLRPAQANCSWDPHFQNNQSKWNRDVTQLVAHLLCKFEALSSTLSKKSPTRPPQKKALMFSTSSD
jgi:hypothetical protein